MLSISTYFLYAYVVLPLFSVGLLKLYAVRYQICPLLVCLPPLVGCIRERECQQFLDRLQECQLETSTFRQKSAQFFAHVQHPTDPAFCRYQAFDSITTSTALDLLECIGSSRCLEPSQFSDECAVIDPSSVVPFESIQENLEGTWNKLFTTGWDVWPCQYTEFHPPASHHPPPESWMKAWPRAENVWRMDLYWRNHPNSTVVFHMNNEMYPHQQWTFDDTRQPSITPPTLKTRAVMWGTEAHENWYVLNVDGATQTMLVYYCAYTMDIRRFDSMAMVLQKQQQSTRELTEHQLQSIEQRALEMLGKKFGTLWRIEKCSMSLS